MPTQDRGRFGEAFSWALWGAAGEDDFGQASASFDTQDQSAPVSDLVIEAVRQPRCFAIAPRNSNGRAILVLAGGGYTQLVIGKEGFEVARWLATLGFHAFVLVHRFPSAAWATVHFAVPRLPSTTRSSHAPNSGPCFKTKNRSTQHWCFGPLFGRPSRRLSGVLLSAPLGRATVDLCPIRLAA